MSGLTAAYSWPFITTIVAGVGTVGLIRYLLRYWEKPGAKWFVLTLLGQAVFCFAYAAGMLVSEPTARYWLEVAALIGLHWMGIPFLGFALAYTGRSKLLRSWAYRSLYLVSVGVILLLPLNNWHNLFWTEFRVAESFGVTVAAYTIEPLLFATVLIVLTAASIGTLLLFDTILSYGPLYRKEALAVALSPIPPSIGIFPWLFSVGPEPHFNAMAVMLLPHVLLDAYAFVGSGMFRLHPATNRAAERSALEDLRSPVFVVDETGQIVDLNEPAKALVDVEEGEAISQSVSEVLGVDVDPTADRRLSLQQDGRRVEFRVESSPLTDSGDNHVGYTLLFQDVTEEIQREERIAVLNRVLRHNLRNDLSVAKGYVVESSERTDRGDIREMLGKADEMLAALSATGETAREIETVVEAADSHQVSVDISETVADVIAQVETEYPNAAITFDSNRSGTIKTNPDVLHSILEELFQNAIEHSESDTPSVEVSVEREDGSVILQVSDNGPGIPAHELESLERGEETALQHGSGLGLWLVKWGTLALGGEISFETDHGTIATLVLPAETDTQ